MADRGRHVMVAAREDRVALGLLAMATAVAFFTTVDTSAKWLILSGVLPLQVIFARYAGHFIASLLVFVPRGRAGVFASARPVVQMARSLVLLGSTILNFNALAFLPITVTTTIMFAGPVVVTLLAIPILKEVVGLHRIAAVCVGFFGVVIVMQPWGAGFHPAMFLMLGALLCSSMYFILTRMLAGVESNATSQIWSSGVPTLCLAPFAVGGWVWPDSGFVMAVLAVIGPLAALGHVAATSAHRMADASVLAPVVYIQLVLAAVAGILVFDTYPTVWTLAGGLVIIAAGLYIWHREGKRRRP